VIPRGRRRGRAVTRPPQSCWPPRRRAPAGSGSPAGRVGFYGTDKIGFAVSRADIAAFTAAQLDDDTYANAAPAISN
jgi:hypothetical protein